MDKNRLDVHNQRQIDKLAAEFVEYAARAITAEPHGSLTVRLEWRAYQAHRVVINSEASKMLAIEPE